MSRIDFKALADAALARAEQLLAIWLPGGHSVGGEWRARNPLRHDNHEGSFSVSITTGAWGDFATDDAGGDLVELYTYLFHGAGKPTAKQRVQAARELADLLGMPDAVPPPPKGGAVASTSAPRAGVLLPDEPRERVRKTPWVPVLPVPANAPEPPRAHEFRGVPERVWTYRGLQGELLGFVCRFRSSDGGKEIIPLTWCRHKTSGACAWKWLQWDEPRPLYGLDRLGKAAPGTPVCVVEGEKCADVGQAELEGCVVLSWPGGGKAVDRADWSPLSGWDAPITTWADCDAKRKKLTKEQVDAGEDPAAQPLLDEADQPGVKTMARLRGILANFGRELFNIQIPAPGEKPDGWDIADAVEEGLSGADLRAWVADRARAWPEAAPEPEPTPQPAAKPPSTPAKAAPARKAKGGKPSAFDERNPPPPDDDEWRYRLKEDRDGNITGCLANVHDVLLNRKEWAGVLGYDEFSQRVIKCGPTPYAGHAENNEWTSVDDTRTAIWMTHEMRMTPTSATVLEAVEVVARLNPVHPVRAYLQGLPAWDGVARLDHWLCDFMHVEDSPYVRLVARWFLLGMVKRVMEPGSKHDYCLVLEGDQGLKKSSALAVLGGAWFADTDLDLHNKDAMSALQGVWLYEFQEMGSVARVEATKQKSFLSRREDKYRPVYGRRDIRVPRQLVFAGTTNEWCWNKDPTGGRRFWPVLVTALVDAEGLALIRDQLFAEALAAWKAGEICYPTPEQQKTLFDPEQLAREAGDDLVDALYEWVHKQVAPFSAAMAAMDGLKLDASKLTRDFQTRLGIALRKLGCTRFEKRNGTVRYWYKPPARNGVTSQAELPSEFPSPDYGMGAYSAADVPFDDNKGVHRAPF